MAGWLATSPLNEVQWDMPSVGVVTGAGRGMGRACLERMVERCDVVLAVDRDRAGLGEATAATEGAAARVVGHVLDVTDRGGVSALAGEVECRGDFRMLAHAAGISPTMADARAVFEVDLVGSALLLRALTPLVRAGSAAVCFASMASHILAPHGDRSVDEVLADPLAGDFQDRVAAALGGAIEDSGVAYAWAKRGVQLLAARTAVEWGRAGGRVCSVSPGMVDTPQGRQEFERQPAMTQLLALTPLQREGRPEELARVVDFLLSDAAGFLTGTDVLVDGGVVAALRAGAAPEGVPPVDGAAG